jgi:hypothetical protein
MGAGADVAQRCRNFTLPGFLPGAPRAEPDEGTKALERVRAGRKGQTALGHERDVDSQR